VVAANNTDETQACRGPTPKLQQQLEHINRLPRSQQRFVMKMIDAVLTQAGA
jgi:hypothetical protein